jgi:hypothetical protein
MTIVSCRHNRRSFVYCCTESLKLFPQKELLSVHDFYCLLQMICPDIPLSLIQDSALTGCESFGENPTLYCFDELSASLYFRFIYTEWLIMVENVFFEGKTRRASITCSLSKLSQHFSDWQRSIPANTSQPSIDNLLSVIDGLRGAAGSTTDVTFDDMISSLLRHEGIRAETSSYRPAHIHGHLSALSLQMLPGAVAEV